MGFRKDCFEPRALAERVVAGIDANVIEGGAADGAPGVGGIPSKSKLFKLKPRGEPQVSDEDLRTL